MGSHTRGEGGSKSEIRVYTHAAEQLAHRYPSADGFLCGSSSFALITCERPCLGRTAEESVG